MIFDEYDRAYDHPLHQELVDQIRQETVDWTERERAAGRRPDTEDRQAFADDVCTRFFSRVAQAHLSGTATRLSEQEERALRATAIRAAFGTPWERWMDPRYSDIAINGPHDVFATVRDTGEKIRLRPVASSESELIEQIRWVAAHGGRVPRRFDDAHPTLNLRLNNGARLHAVMAPISMKTSVSIRIHSTELSRVDDLYQAGMIDRVMLGFFKAAVRARKTMIVVGSTGAGKTTLSRALLNEVPPDERIITVEDDMELGLSSFPDLHPDVVEYEARPANAEGQGAFTMADCLHHCLRQNPSRVVVGEARGAEVISFIQAVSNGLTGSFTTVHANSTGEAFDRLVICAQMAPQPLTRETMLRMVGMAVDFVIHVANSPETGRRAVTSIREITGFNDLAGVESIEVWGEDRNRPDGRGYPTGQSMSAPMRADLARLGFDATQLRHHGGFWVDVDPAATLRAARLSADTAADAVSEAS